MSRFCIGLLCLLFLFSCRFPSPEENNLIPEEKMILVMRDVFLAESILNFQQVDGIDFGENAKQKYQAIFTQYEISEDDFRKTNIYYLNHPDKYHEIIEKSIEELSKLDAQLEAKGYKKND